MSLDQNTQASLGDLVSTATRELSTLFRQEVALAKVELTGELKAAGKGAGMFGGAGLTGLLAVVFLSVAAAFGLAGLGLPLGVGFLLVGAAYALAGGVLALRGKQALHQIELPRETVRTVRDDLAWAKHPTRPS